MNPERYQQVFRIVVEALRRDGEARDIYLIEACQGDLDLLAEVENLLAAEAGSSQTITRPSAESATLPRLGEDIDGRVVGDFKLLRRLGSGGMSEIYEAEQLSLGRLVALKVLRIDDERQALLARRRFLREARIHGRLDHPGIAAIHALASDAGGEPFFAMKVVRGRSLAQAIQSERARLVARDPTPPFTLRERLDVFTKACEAVAYAHAQGVLHRDLKPANIMIGEYGEVQVLDWGLATFQTLEAVAPTHVSPDTQPGVAALEEDGSSAGLALDTPTVDGAIVGTPAYMSPEQARGEIQALDARTDVYALGAVLYSLLALQPPYWGSTPQHVLARVKRGEAEPPSVRVTGNAEFAAAGYRGVAELDAVVMKAMALNPGDRYESVTELRDEIHRFLEGRLLRAAQYTSRQRLGKLLRRHRGKVLAVVAVAVVGLAGLLASGVSAARASALALEPSAAALASLRDSASTLDRARASRDYGQALHAARELSTRLEASARLLRGHATVVRERPEWIAEVSTLEHRVDREQPELLGAWLARIVAEHHLDTIDPAAMGADEAAALEQECRPLVEFRDVADRSGVEISEPLLFLARRADALARAARRERLSDSAIPRDLAEAPDAADDEVVRLVVEAWQAAPRSLAAAEGFVLLAERTLESANHQDAVRDACMGFHLALGLFGSQHPRAQVHARLGAARALMRITAGQPAPFAPGVSANRMALAFLGHIVGPRGRLLPSVDVALGRASPQMRQALTSDAADLLAIARRLEVRGSFRSASSGESQPDDYTPVETAPGVLISTHAATLEVKRWRVSAPDAPPFAPPTIVEEATFDLAPLIPFPRADLARLDLEGLPLRPGGASFIVRALHRQGPATLFVFPSADLQAPPEVIQTLGGDRAVAQGDLDGDGYIDLATAENIDQEWRIRVRRRNEHGVLQPPIDLTRDESVPNYAEAESIRGLVSADLDGDGREEILVTRSPWRGFCMQLYQLDATGALRLRAWPFVGVGRMKPVIEGGRTLVFVDAVSDWKWRLWLQATGVPVPATPSVYGWDGQTLAPLASGWPQRVQGGVPHNLDMVGQLEHGAYALSDSSQAAAGASLWFIYEGEIGAPRTARIHVVADRAQPLGANLYVTSRGITRALRDDEIQAIVAEGIVTKVEGDAARELAGVSSDPLLPARLLMRFDAPAAAARLLASLRRADPRLRVAARRHEVRALLEAKDGVGLLALVRSEEFPPAEDEVETFIEAVDATFQITTRFEDLLPTISRWSNAPALSRWQRERLVGRYAAWKESAAAIGAKATGLLDGRLAGVLVANDPALAAFDGQGAWQVRTASTVVPSAHLPVGGKARPAHPGLLVARDGALVASPVPALAGLAVGMSPGAFRISIEFTHRGHRFGEFIEPFLGSLADPSQRAQLFFLASGGGARVDHVHLREPLGVNIDRVLGKRLRYDFDVLPALGVTRATLVEVESGHVLKASLEPLTAVPPAPVCFVGIIADQPAAHDFEIHTIAVRGAARALQTGDAALAEVLERRRDLQGVTACMALRQAGDAAGAAQELLELAEDYGHVAESAAPEDAARLRARSAQLEIEAQWIQSGASSPADIRRLLEAKVEAGTLNEDDVVAWALERAGFDDALAAAGVAGAVLEGETEESPDVETASDEALEAAARLRYVRGVARAQGDPRGLFDAACAAADGLRSPVLCDAVLRLAAGLPEGVDLDTEARRAVLACLLVYCRRTEALARLQPGDSLAVWGSEATGELLRLVDELRRQELEFLLATTRARGQDPAFLTR